MKQQLRLLTVFCLMIFSYLIHGQAPINDDCGDPNPIANLGCTGSGVSVSGTTVDATPEAFGSSCGVDMTTIPGVWYEFTALGSDLSITGTAGLSVVLFSGCGSADEVICVASLPLQNVEGQGDDLLETDEDYLIWVGFSSGTTGTFDLCVNNVMAPENDLCEDALDMMSSAVPAGCDGPNTYQLVGTTMGASEDLLNGMCVNGGGTYQAGVWYEFEAEGPDIYFTNQGGTPTPSIAIVQLTCPIPSGGGTVGTQIICGMTDIDRMTATSGDDVLEVGEQYYIWVGFSGDVEDDFDICVWNPPPPANDLCDDAIALNANQLECNSDESTGQTISGTTEHSSPDGFGLSCGGVSGLNDGGVFYSFTAQGYDLFITDEEGNNPVIAILEYTCGDPVFIETICTQGEVNYTTPTSGDNVLEPGVDYLMWVVFPGGVETNFEFCFENPEPPSNDLCDDAIALDFPSCAISPEIPPIEGDLRGAFPDFEFSCLGGSGGWDGIWYSFDVEGYDLLIESPSTPTPHVVISSQCTAGTATFLECLTLTPGSNYFDDLFDDSDIGMTYYVWVALPGGEDGTFELCIDNPAPPVNDKCVGAIPIMVNCDDPLNPVNTMIGTIDYASWYDDDFIDLTECELGIMVDPHQVVWYELLSQGVDFSISDLNDLGLAWILVKNTDCAPMSPVVACGMMPYHFLDDPDDLLDVSQTYLLGIVNMNPSTTPLGEFELCVHVPHSPPNDLCNRAERLSSAQLSCEGSSGATVVGTTVNSSQGGMSWPDEMWNPGGTPPNPPPNMWPCPLDTTEDDGVWYFFEAVGQDLTIEEVSGASPPPTVYLFSENGCSDTVNFVTCTVLPLVANSCTDPGSAVTIEGERYYLYVTFPGGESQNSDFELCVNNSGSCTSDPPIFWCDADPACSLAELQGACLQTQRTNAAGGIAPWPGCNTNSIEGPTWFTFFAGGDFIHLEVCVNGCVNNYGLQMALYELDCQYIGQPPCSAADIPPANIRSNCTYIQSPTSNGGIVNFTSSVEEGHYYGIMFDGNAGDVCNVRIAVIEGTEPPSYFPEPGPIVYDEGLFPHGTDTICVGATGVEFQTSDLASFACNTTWTLNGDEIPNNSTDISKQILDFPDPGKYTLCLSQGNYPCIQSIEVCRTVFVYQEPDKIDAETLCEGEDYIWIGPFGTQLELNPPALDLPGGRIEIYDEVEVLDPPGCRANANLTLTILNENDENPTEIDTVTCIDNLPIELAGEIFTEATAPTGVVTDFEFQTTDAHGDYMCDSFFTLDLYVLSAWIDYTIDEPEPLFESHVNCEDEVISLCPVHDPLFNPRFGPDPDVYNIRFDFEWYVNPNGLNPTPIGISDTCVDIRFSDFEDPIEEFGVFVHMSIEGRPAGGCMFGPFTQTLNIENFIPDSVQIDGPSEVCVGPEYVYIMTDVAGDGDDIPSTEVTYDWDFSGMPGAVLVNTTDNMQTISFSELGSGEICVTPRHPCSDGPQTCFAIDVVEIDPGNAGPEDEECENVYQLIGSPSGGTWITVSQPTGTTDPVFADATSGTTQVTVEQKGDYTFGWVREQHGCYDTATVLIHFVQPIQLVGDITTECDAINENYTATFDFVGGVPPYTVTSGNGTITGNTFTSDLVTAGEELVVIITDADGCASEFRVTGTCPCLTVPAEMDLQPIVVCGETCIQADTVSAPVEDPNDISLYILHTEAGPTLGTRIASNESGEFCYTPGGPIQLGVQYYVSLVTGNEVGGDIDFTHHCTRVPEGQPVIWHAVPTPDAGADDATCGTSYGLNVANSQYSGRWSTLPGSISVTFDDANSSTATVSVSSGVCGLALLVWEETNAICVTRDTVEIDFYCNPTTSTPTPSCNADFTELFFTFTLNGTEPFTQTGGPTGTIDGNSFEIRGLPAPYAGGDVLTFEDGHGCSVTVTLPRADCNCIPLLTPDTICGLSTTLLSDGTGNGGMWSFVSGPAGENAVLSSPGTRQTEVTVTNYGAYTFGWVENGDLCDGYAEVTIIFADAPDIIAGSEVYSCDNLYENYTVTFEIEGGHAPTYRVLDGDGNPAGTLTGNVFTSNTIPSPGSMTFYISDAFGCSIAEVTLSHDCGCGSAVGSVMAMQYYCDGDETQIVYDNTTEVLDGNDRLVYILYTDPLDPLGSIIAQNQTGRFAFDETTMTLGTTYYISAVVGNSQGAGQVDLTHPCTVVSEGAEVVWFDETDPQITASDQEFTCLITQMTLTVTADGLPDDYTIVWTASNGGSIAAGQETSQSPQINAPGVYTVTLTHGLAGCSSSTSIEIGQSDDVPVVQLSSDDPLTCAQTEATITSAGSTTGADITYTWTGPGIVGPTDGTTITVNQPGDYTLTLVDQSNGCEVSGTQTIRIDNTDPTAQASAPDLLTCSVEQVMVSGGGSSTGSNIRYSWRVVSGEGQIIGSTTGQNITVDGIGVYEIEVTNADNGCVSTAQATVRADDSVITGINVNVRQLSCDGGGTDGRIAIASVQGGTQPYRFSIDGGQTYTTDIVWENLSAGVYTIDMIDGNGCTYSEMVTLTQPVDFTVDLGETIIVDFGDTAYITAATTLADSLIKSIDWSATFDSLGSPDGLNWNVVPDLGQYNVYVDITSLNDCVRRANVLLVVRFAERLYIPNVMRPTSDIPSNQRIYIFADPESVKAIHYFAIYDRWGERMFERKDIPPSLEIQPEYAWDGMWKGQLAPAEGYVYYAEVEFITGVRKLVKGSFVIVN